MSKPSRHKRHSASQCVTCAGQHCRHKRHTPLGGVTTVTLAVLFSYLVPMPLDTIVRGTVVGTVPFSLPKNGEN